MNEKENAVSLNFFKKVWYSITKFEKYPVMAAEGLANAIKYLLTIIVLITIITLFNSLMEMQKTINNLAEYIEQNIPEFSVEEGIVKMDTEAPIVINDIQYSGIDKIVVNTLIENEEEKEQFKKDEIVVGTTIIFFKDEIILENKSDENTITEKKYTYNEFVTNYTKENIETFNKAQLVEYLTGEKMNEFYLNYGISIFIYIFVINMVYALFDALQIGILGWITTLITRIRMRFVAIYNMSVYALTLSMILNMLYILVNCFVSFKITYFKVAYIAIAYIYMITAIFILKDDLTKKMQEIDKVRQEQKKAKEEIQKQENKTNKPEKNDKEDKDDSDNEEDEPQGSEA